MAFVFDSLFLGFFRLVVNPFLGIFGGFFGGLGAGFAAAAGSFFIGAQAGMAVAYGQLIESLHFFGPLAPIFAAGVILVIAFMVIIAVGFLFKLAARETVGEAKEIERDIEEE